MPGCKITDTNTALQKSNIILESINKKLKDNEKKMQIHNKTVQDTIAASAEVIEAQGKDAMDYLKALECMQILSDSRTGVYGCDGRLDQGKLGCSILEVFVENTRAEDKAEEPFVYMHLDKVEDYSEFREEMEDWGIDLRASRLVYVEGREYTKRKPFQPDEWSMHLETFCRIEISSVKSRKAYEVACFDSEYKD